MEEAKRRQSRQITWVPIKQLQEATGWGRTKLEEWRDQGKFIQQSGKVGSISIIWKMFSDSAELYKNKKHPLKRRFERTIT